MKIKLTHDFEFVKVKVLNRGKRRFVTWGKQGGYRGRRTFHSSIFGDKTSKSRHLRVPKKTVKVVCSPCVVVLSLNILRLRLHSSQKEGFELSLVASRGATPKVSRSIFSRRIEDLENSFPS